MPAIFELIVMHRSSRCVGQVGVIQTLFSSIWAASTWDTKCITARNYEWTSHTDCTNTGQLRCHNCSSGMTAMKILTRIEISPVEGPQSIFWHRIGSLLLLAECTYISKRSSSTPIFRVTAMHPCFGRFVRYLILIFWYLFTAVGISPGGSGR
jgi:hypothetical protein